VASTSNVQATGPSVLESTEDAIDSISTPCTPAVPSTSGTVSFQKLLPVPHRTRPPTRAVGKKPPSPELNSDETLKFVSEVLEKQTKKKAGAATKGVKPCWQQQPIKKRGPSAVKLASIVEDDHEPCAMCKVAYGDASDPKKKDNWERCTRCKWWWHETCATLSGTNNKGMFLC